MKRNKTTDMGELRIIGGDLRNRKISYPIDPRTRPMKDRTRGALFNIAGQKLNGCAVIDLFSGSGIIAIESISRGALHAVAVEKHAVTANRIRVMAAKFGISEKLTVLTMDVFDAIPSELQLLSSLRENRWVVTICPPFDLWLSETEKLRGLIDDWLAIAPDESMILCEVCDKACKFTPEPGCASLPSSLQWKFYVHRPSVLASHRKTVQRLTSDDVKG